MTDGFPSFPTPLPQAKRRRSGWIILALILIIATGAGIAWWQQSPTVGGNAAVAGVSLSDSSVRAPAGLRLQVRVVNATNTRALARRATLLLRDFGYDVVDTDTDTRRRRETTLIQVHKGNREVGERIRRVLGTGEIEVRADSLRYLDFTILLGSDWKPPTEPLRP